MNAMQLKYGYLTDMVSSLSLPFYCGGGGGGGGSDSVKNPGRSVFAVLVAVFLHLLLTFYSFNQLKTMNSRKLLQEYTVYFLVL